MAEIFEGVGANVPLWKDTTVQGDDAGNAIKVSEINLNELLTNENIDASKLSIGITNFVGLETKGVNTIEYIKGANSIADYKMVHDLLASIDFWEDGAMQHYDVNEKINVFVPFNNLDYGINQNVGGTVDHAFAFYDKNNHTYNQAVFYNQAGNWTFVITRKRYFVPVRGSYDGYNYVGFILTDCTPNPQWAGVSASVRMMFVRLADVQNVVGNSTLNKIDIDDPILGRPAITGGFEGIGSAFNVVREAIQLPTAPSLGVSTTGLLNVYTISEGALEGFGGFLFQTDNGVGDFELPEISISGVSDITNIMMKSLNGVNSRIGTAYRQAVNGDLVQYVIDCHIVPFRPTVIHQHVPVKVGWKTFQTSASKVSSDYVDYNCGNLLIDSMYNNFLDMAAQIRLFIPFVGFVNLDPQDVMGKYINLTYRFNVIDGSFIAFVRVVLDDNSLTVIGTYGGSSCVHMPLTGVNYSNVISGMMQTATGIVSKNPFTIIGGATQTFGGTKAEQSNPYNASASFMGNRRPFVIIDYPVQQLPANYYHSTGAPLEAKMRIGDLSGYAVIKNPDMSDISGIDQAERDEIRQLLESGVYL